MIRYPSRIAPSVTAAVTGTYDIFPTALSLAGVSLPSNRTYDGVDLSPLLFNPSHTAPLHDCIYIYKGTPLAACPKAHPNCPGLWAVRCGAYKVSF